MKDRRWPDAVGRSRGTPGFRLPSAGPATSTFFPEARHTEMEWPNRRCIAHSATTRREDDRSNGTKGIRAVRTKESVRPPRGEAQEFASTQLFGESRPARRN